MKWLLSHLVTTSRSLVIAVVIMGARQYWLPRSSRGSCYCHIYHQWKIEMVEMTQVPVKSTENIKFNLTRWYDHPATHPNLHHP
ncbi:hypothetical protein V8B97DRAFT_22384 [Scleroderma yunnanense]